MTCKNLSLVFLRKYNVYVNVQANMESGRKNNETFRSISLIVSESCHSS